MLQQREENVGKQRGACSRLGYRDCDMCTARHPAQRQPSLHSTAGAGRRCGVAITSRRVEVHPRGMGRSRAFQTASKDTDAEDSGD